jgi:hypothetical protein
MDRDEFQRRFDAMPHLKKAELIEGVVYMPSPVGWHRHATPHANLMTWLGVYQAHTPGTQIGDNGSIRLDLGNRNMPQPDAALIIEPERGGQAVIGADDYLEGGPELVGEVAASSVAIDLHDKLQAYLRNRVREYLVWRVLDRAVDWFVLRGGQYDRLLPGPDGLYRSEVFPGLWLDPAALDRRDIAAVLQTLQQGLATPEHAAFVARLQPGAPGGTP